MSQLASSLSERPKGTLPSQPLVNLKTSNQAYKIQDPSINQCNVVHTLWSGKKVDNKVYQQKNSVHPDATPAFTSASSSQTAPHTSDEDKVPEQVHKPVAPFPSRLRNNNKNMHMEKMLEMFNQVKLNVPLLDAIQQVPASVSYTHLTLPTKRIV